jgi:hypothetical protein
MCVSKTAPLKLFELLPHVFIFRFVKVDCITCILRMFRKVFRNTIFFDRVVHSRPKLLCIRIRSFLANFL